MTIAIESQLAAFGGALLVGAALGLFYDMLRPLRHAASRALAWGLDIVFWLVAALAVFFSAPLLENGQIRIYMLLANALGGLLYFLLLSRFFRRFDRWFRRQCRRLKAFLLRPLRWIYMTLTAPLSLFLKFLKKRSKKLFSFLRGWVMIRRTSKNMRKRQRAADKEELRREGKPVYHQKGWYSFEDRGGGASGLHHLHDGADAGEDRRSQ